MPTTDDQKPLDSTLRFGPVILLVLTLLLSACGSDENDTTVTDANAETDTTAEVLPAEETVAETPAPTLSTPDETVDETVAETAAPTLELPDADSAEEPRLTGSLLAESGERTEWTGSIGYDIGITMWLAQSGDLVRGEITYNTVGEPIMVLGQAYLDGDGYFLQELGSDGRVSGYLTLGSVSDGVVADGTWGEQPLVLEYNGIAEDPYFFDPLVRPGHYVNAHPPFAGDDECCGATGSMTISDVSENSATIAFDNVTSGPGYNQASIDPTDVPLVNNRALYESTDDGYDCAFEVMVFDGFAFVDHVDDRFDCGFGNAASVVGMYVLAG